MEESGQHKMFWIGSKDLTMVLIKIEFISSIFNFFKECGYELMQEGVNSAMLRMKIFISPLIIMRHAQKRSGLAGI